MSESKTENQEHQKGRKLGWKLREARYPFRNEVMTLREDHLDVPKIGAETFAYVEQGGAVMIVPLTDDGQIVFIRQYRYPVDAFCLEVPAGKMSDTPDLSIEEVAAKELFEEIGGKASRLELMDRFTQIPRWETRNVIIFWRTAWRWIGKANPSRWRRSRFG